MRVVYNNLLPFKGFVGIYLFGVLFVRKEYENKLDVFVINHESIHDKQAKRMLFIFFYLWYIVEYLCKLFVYKFDSIAAYRNISFEREAYANMYDLSYPSQMPWYSFLKYVRKK